MSSAVRTRAPRKSDLNTPVVVHVAKSKVIEDEEAQVILTKFIEESERFEEESLSTTLNSENGSRSTYSGPPTEKISHLKRLQRELRGLPPILAEPRPKKKKVEEAPANKKIKFDDDATPVNKKVVFDDEVATPNKKIVFEDDAMDVDTPEKPTYEPLEEEEETGKKDKKEKKKKDKKEKKEKKEKKDKKEKKEKKKD